MTANNDSEFSGIIRFPTGSLAYSDPMDTGHVREGLINNLEALYNGSAQVRVNTTLRDPIQVGDANNPLASGYDERSYRKMATFEFPLMLLKDGTAAPVYVEIAGARVGAGNTQIAVQLRYRGAATFDVFSSAGGRVTLTSTSFDWYVVTTNDGAPRLTFPTSRPLATSLLRTRNHPDETKRTTDSAVIEAAVDVYAHIEPGSSGTGVRFAGIIVRESPWNKEPT